MALRSKSSQNTGLPKHVVVNTPNQQELQGNQKVVKSDDILAPRRASKLAIGILASLCIALPVGTYFTMKSQQEAAADPAQVKTAVEKFGVVQNQHTIGNITANVVKTDAGQAVIYSTKDGQNLIMGDIYDLDGKPVFEEVLQQLYNASANNVPQAATAEGGVGQVLGEFKGELPETFNYLESLGGYKQDPSKSPADTVYVVYDPRCPYCHEFFRKTQNIDLEAKGVTIKWLPTTALGQAEPGSDAEKLAAKGLHINSAEEFAQTFQKNPTIPDIEVTDEDRAKLNENLLMLMSSVEEINGPNAPKSVPTAFYMDKQAGVPRLVAGPNEASVFAMIFGD